jgi:hypothetical protein
MARQAGGIAWRIGAAGIAFNGSPTTLATR